MIHHSDHGSEYTAVAFSDRCLELGITRSMGSVGDCFDNAMMESLFSSLEAEVLDRYHFATREEARRTTPRAPWRLIRRSKGATLAEIAGFSHLLRNLRPIPASQQDVKDVCTLGKVSPPQRGRTPRQAQNPPADRPDGIPLHATSHRRGRG